MITLFNRSTLPRDGYSYYYLPPSKPEAVFTIPNGVSLSDAKKRLMQYRALNPWLGLPADEASVEHELILYTYARLKASLGLKYARKFFTVTSDDDPDILKMEEEVKKKEPLTTPSMLQQLKDVAGAADEFKDVMRSWLGEGLRPVSQEQAQERAGVCLQCNLNVPANWLERLAASVAGVAMQFVEAKNKMNLHTIGEENLHMCRACRCVLQSKVFVPISHIAAGTSAETLEKLKAGKNCWIISELSKA